MSVIFVPSLRCSVTAAELTKVLPSPEGSAVQHQPLPSRLPQTPGGAVCYLEPSILITGLEGKRVGKRWTRTWGRRE